MLWEEELVGVRVLRQGVNVFFLFTGLQSNKVFPFVLESHEFLPPLLCCGDRIKNTTLSYSIIFL